MSAALDYTLGVDKRKALNISVQLNQRYQDLSTIHGLFMTIRESEHILPIYFNI